MTEGLSLEQQLVRAIIAGEREQARTLARALHERGFDYTALSAALAEHPGAEEELAEVMRQVIPLSRREARRRAIRAAEERDWGDWGNGKREV